jgi:murein DD-endopeptidase MepM/ murein hydrolase activator NlpD
MLIPPKKFLLLIIIPLIILLVALSWFLTVIFEGETPTIDLDPLPLYLSESTTGNLQISDRKRGLKKLKVVLSQEGREFTILDKKFPFKGLFNRQGLREYAAEFAIDPSRHDLAQGRVDLHVHVWDFSRKGGGDGNHAVAHHKMIIDTIPPAIRAVSRMHNVNLGGVGLIIYQASSDTKESGIFVEDHFFPGFAIDGVSMKGIHHCYFALPFNAGSNPSIYLWAKDRAENESRTTFYCHLRKRKFRKERIKITDRFLKRVLPYFSFFPDEPGESEIQRYLRINNQMREENHRTLFEMGKSTDVQRLWEGPWLRLKNSATMAKFGDHRVYVYRGETVDEQFHLGVDLASMANSPVQAGNNGRVVFADRLGIYGISVLLDHGQGIASLYGHLSQAAVTAGQDVQKGDLIGYTGQTGLAGGDHLHFSMIVNGVFVNPIEWWDAHWIQDNITRKAALLEGNTS